MDTALEAILRVMLSQDEMIESSGDVSEYHSVFGYCVFDVETMHFMSIQHADIIETYGNPFTGTIVGNVYYVYLSDAGVINVHDVGTVEYAEKVYTQDCERYDRFNNQCADCGAGHNETAVCER